MHKTLVFMAVNDHFGATGIIEETTIGSGFRLVN